jgi:hypothetical protein
VLQEIIKKQILLTRQDPISKDEAASKTVEKATASGTLQHLDLVMSHQGDNEYRLA